MSWCLVFPGQGSQAVGMLTDLATEPAGAAVIAEADEALGFALSSLMNEGPTETLTLTENAQPALLTVSIAVWRVLEARGLAPAVPVTHMAGHSLGEFSALTAAGVLSFSDAVRLVRLRGQAMQSAVPVGEGGMAAVLGLDMDVIAAITRTVATETGAVCVAANDNAPGQVVISGALAAVELAAEQARTLGAKRVLALPVSAPFHSPMMAPAADRLREALAATGLNAPSVPVIANVTAGAVTDPERLRTLLVEQVTAPVRWRESMMHAADAGVTQLLEVGSGKVLSGLARRIDRRLGARATGDLAGIAAAVAAFDGSQS
jgi:[acyl-carrier-protein] S-malonyltransferase